MGDLQVSHVAVKVDSIEESIKFYNSFFGFLNEGIVQLPNKRISFLFLENNPSFKIELIEEEGDNDFESKNVQIDHIAFNVNNIDYYMDKLKEVGIELDRNPTKTAKGQLTIFFRGINNELFQLTELN